ncbi:MAG: hypothetical protein L0Y35_03310 [Flammeovirgaceae bacterium]|nr:hypothetical protein [Flammeovirgaceae bacterium]
MKLAGKVYKGIHYIELRDLPQDHQRRIVESYGNECLIKIVVDHSIVRNCIQYKDYETWYKVNFSSVEAPVVGSANGILALEGQLKSVPNA